MTTKKYYITTQASNEMWNYVGDPLNPNTTLDVGLVAVSKEEIRVDEFGAYVVKNLLE